MHKGFFKDPRLSFKAKGILGYLLTKPDNWVVRISDLMNHAKDGRDSVYAGLKELHEHNYYHKVQARDAKGRLSHWECFVCEVPMATNTSFSTDLPDTENPNTAKPFTDNPDTENPNTVKPDTENPNTDKPNTENPSLSDNYISNNDLNKNYHSNNDCSNNNPTPTSAPPAKDNFGEAVSVERYKKPEPNTNPNPAKIQYAEFVSMTNDEYSSLVAKIGEDGAAWCINKLDNYKGSTGKKYDSDYRTIHSWVIGRYQEYLQTQTEHSRSIRIGHTREGAESGDAFEDYVLKKIEEVKLHGTTKSCLRHPKREP